MLSFKNFLTVKNSKACKILTFLIQMHTHTHIKYTYVYVYYNEVTLKVFETYIKVT